MYQQMFAAGEYDSAAEYDTLHALAKAEYEEEQARENAALEYAMEDPNIEGGEMNVYDNKSLKDHIPDVLDFIGLSANENIEMMSEKEFPIGF